MLVTKPRLSIDVDNMNGLLRIAELTPEGRWASFPSVKLRHDWFENLTRYLPRKLKTLKTAVSNKPFGTLSWPVASEGIAALTQAGLCVLNILFEDDVAIELAGILKDFAQRRAPGAYILGDPLARLPTIAIRSQGNTVLPLEYAPLLGIPPSGDLRTYSDLSKTLGCFVGFRFNTRRVLQVRGTPSRARVPRLSSDANTTVIGYYQDIDDDRVASVDEVRRLARIFPALADAPRMPLPTMEAVDIVDYVAGTVDDDILHLACHCYVGSADPRIYFLVRAEGGKEHQIDINTVSEQITKWRHEGRPAGWAGFIFANACGSGAVTPITSLGWPQETINKSAKAVVAVDTQIPGRFAARFSEIFYSGAVRGLPVDGAIGAARGQLALQLRNPLGILYNLFTDAQWDRF